MGDSCANPIAPARQRLVLLDPHGRFAWYTVNCMLIYKGEVCEGRRADERVRANEAERGLSSESRQRAVGNLCVWLPIRLEHG